MHKTLCVTLFAFLNHVHRDPVKQVWLSQIHVYNK